MVEDTLKTKHLICKPWKNITAYSSFFKDLWAFSKSGQELQNKMEDRIWKRGQDEFKRLSQDFLFNWATEVPFYNVDAKE